MPALVILAGLFAVFFGATINQIHSIQQWSDRTNQRIVGENMAAYSTFVAAYAKPRPATFGSVNDTTLGVPAWFVRLPDAGNYIAGGVGYAWINAGSQAMATQMAANVQGGARAGVKINGRLQTPGATSLGPILPSAIPDGAMVVMR